MILRYLILALTTRCNLSCAYCYIGGGGLGTDMGPEAMDAAFNLARRAVSPAEWGDGSGGGPLHIQLTGGEPTLVPRLIERAIRKTRALARPVTLGIQTNAARLTPAMASLLRENGVQVGVSLDGPPAVQDRLRGRAGETLRGLQVLEAGGVPFRVTAVVTRESAAHLKSLALLLAGFRQARGIGLDLLVRKGRAAQNGTAVAPVSPEVLRDGVRALAETLDAVNARRDSPIRFRERDWVRRALESGRTRPETFCHAARGESLAVHPDGRIFPCGQTLGDSRFAAGTVFRPELERLDAFPPRPPSIPSDDPLAASPGSAPDCGDCPLAGRCPGECPSRLFYNDGGRGLHCVMYRALAER